jgi:dimethylargininase
MLTALTRKPSPRLALCELEFLPREPIDFSHAVQQHAAYEKCLVDLGASLISLPTEEDLPDCVFVEDPALVLDEVAIINRMGAIPRRPEAESLAMELSKYRELRWISEPATVEGGDVFRIGRKLYVGVSRRTNFAGIEQLGRLIAEFGYTVHPVDVGNCLHLKTACCPLSDDLVLANRDLIDASDLGDLHILDVPEEEPWAADVLLLGGTVIESNQFPRTCELLERHGFRVKAIDVSELQKAEAGVTCMSLIFEVK